MITLSLIRIVLELLGGLVTGATSLIGRPPDAAFLIPAPFIDVFQQFIVSAGGAVPALTIFYLWRQVKS